LSDIRGASSAASAVVIGIDAIRPIDAVRPEDCEADNRRDCEDDNRQHERIDEV